MDSMFASTFAYIPVRSAQIKETLMYVSIRNCFYDDDLIYIYTQLIFILISLLKIMTMRDQLLPHQRVLAIQEELAGFLLDEVISEKGEFHGDLI